MKSLFLLIPMITFWLVNAKAQDINCSLEINMDSSDFSGYPYDEVYVEGIVTLFEPLNPYGSGVVQFEIEWKKTEDGFAGSQAFYVEILDSVQVRVYGYFSPSLWGLEPLSDTAYIGVEGVHHELFPSQQYNTYYSDFTIHHFPWVVTGTDEVVDKQTSFNTYPNPFVNQITVQSKEVTELYDITGKVLATYNPGKDAKTLDVSSLASGMYFLRTRPEDPQRGSKIIKLTKH